MSHTIDTYQSPLKKSQSGSTIVLNHSQVHLPSRYVQLPKQEKSGLQQILSSIQTQFQDDKPDKQHSPNPKFKILQDHLREQGSSQKKHASLFKCKPLKREDNDMVQFKEIFLNPREESLKAISKLKPIPDHSKNIVKKYEKLLKFERGEPLGEDVDKDDSYMMKENYEQAIEFLETISQFPKQNKVQTEFYSSQIVLQVPSSNTGLTIISGPKLTISPSLPSNYRNNKDVNLNLKQLLLRSKAGTNSEDMEKEAHLSFYLGEVYSEKKLHRQALKFYKRFLGFAKIMEDKVGMCVGANRVGVSHHNCKEYEKSIKFHNENLKLSDQNNYFCGLYNIGISYRQLKKYQQAVQYFEGALNCAKELDHEESQSIAYSQLGVTYQHMQQFQQAIESFEESLELSRRTKNKNLKLNNLENILKISSMLKLKSNRQLRNVAEEAFIEAKELGQLASMEVLRCNIGVLRGSEALPEQSSQEFEEIQQIL